LHIPHILGVSSSVACCVLHGFAFPVVSKRCLRWNGRRPFIDRSELEHFVSPRHLTACDLVMRISRLRSVASIVGDAVPDRYAPACIERDRGRRGVEEMEADGGSRNGPHYALRLFQTPGEVVTFSRLPYHSHSSPHQSGVVTSSASPRIASPTHAGAPTGSYSGNEGA
jgi:hypothetical protein